MNHAKFLALLKAGFANRKDPPCCGGLVVPESPIDLHKACFDALESDLERGDFHGGDEKDVLSEAGWSFDELVGFYWESGFPMVWVEYLLELRHSKHGSYAVLDGDDGLGTRIIARLEPSAVEDSRRILFEQLIGDNGASLSTQIFGSLPSDTHNHVEDQIPKETVREAYWRWLNRNGADDEQYKQLAEIIIARKAEPVTYGRTLLMRAFRRLEEADTYYRPNWRLSERDRRAIFNAYFDQSYGPY